MEYGQAPGTTTGRTAATGRPADSTNMPIPVLCHQPHMKPVAVCRLCVVQIYGQKRGKRAAERKLFPACQHPVKEGMEVFTMNAPGAASIPPSTIVSRNFTSPLATHPPTSRAKSAKRS